MPMHHVQLHAQYAPQPIVLIELNIALTRVR
jgi:hypothetical protein